MQSIFVKSTFVALILGLTPFMTLNSADAQSRVAPPPVYLSPGLAEPWTLQLAAPQRTQRTTHRTQQGRQVVQQQRRQVGQQERRRATGIFAAFSNNQNRQPRTQAAQRVAAAAYNPRPTTPSRQIAPQFLPTVVPYTTSHKAGTIIIDTNTRYLYLVQGDGTARRYGVGVGRPGFEWAGTHKVTRKAEWPDWRPPAAMRKRQPDLPAFMPGGPANPMGARALYLGSTLYRIHGSNEPWTIGGAVSSGCIRMRNEDVIDLYNRVGVGVKVIVS